MTCFQPREQKGQFKPVLKTKVEISAENDANVEVIKDKQVHNSGLHTCETSSSGIRHVTCGHRLQRPKEIKSGIQQPHPCDATCGVSPG